MEDDYTIIKAKYGETFARLCRRLFPTILEQQGKLAQIITSHFAPTHTLYRDLAAADKINDFEDYIFLLAKPPVAAPSVETDLSPEELMRRAGYTLYPECKTQAEIMEFMKYYAPHEELCTFNDNRLRTNRVWFAVKNNASKLKRKKFCEPARQDEYGTSVISIQFSRNELQTLSIKNRYNHTVKNPDATFGNNLDHIIAGLSDAFRKYYHCENVNHETDFEIPNYLCANDGKFYRFNFEAWNAYFCENNVLIINGDPITFDRHSQILADDYLFDFRRNQVKHLDNYLNSKAWFTGNEEGFAKDYHVDLEQIQTTDAFTHSLGQIESMSVTKDGQHGKIIQIKSVGDQMLKIVHLDRHQQIIGYRDHALTAVGNGFLAENRALRELDLPHLTSTGESFLFANQELENLTLPELRSCDFDFLYCNEKLTHFAAPKLKQITGTFLTRNLCLTPANLVTPNLTYGHSRRAWEADDGILGNNPEREAFYYKFTTQHVIATTRER